MPISTLIVVINISTPAIEVIRRSCAKVWEWSPPRQVFSRYSLIAFGKVSQSRRFNSISMKTRDARWWCCLGGIISTSSTLSTARFAAEISLKRLFRRTRSMRFWSNVITASWTTTPRPKANEHQVAWWASIVLPPSNSSTIRCETFGCRMSKARCSMSLQSPRPTEIFLRAFATGICLSTTCHRMRTCPSCSTTRMRFWPNFVNIGIRFVCLWWARSTRPRCTRIKSTSSSITTYHCPSSSSCRIPLANMIIFNVRRRFQCSTRCSKIGVRLCCLKTSATSSWLSKYLLFIFFKKHKFNLFCWQSGSRIMSPFRARSP